MLPEMLEPVACVTNHTATFLILDITDKLSKHTQCASKVPPCNTQYPVLNMLSLLHQLLFASANRKGLRVMYVFTMAEM